MGGVVRGGEPLVRIHRCIPALPVALALVGCFVVERPASHRLRQEIARIRAAGEPLTFDELRAGVATGDGMDAAADYGAATALLSDVDIRPVFNLVGAYRGGTGSCSPVPPSVEVRERGRQMLAEAQPALELIDRAARTEHCHYTWNIDTGELPPLAPFHAAGGLLSLRTLDSTFAGDADGAAASLISKLRMLRVFDTEPVLITYLVRLSEWSQAGADLAAVLGAGGLSDASLGGLDEALRQAEAPELLRRMIEGERLWELQQLAAVLGPDWPDGGLRSTGAERLPFRERGRVLRQASDYVAVTAAMTRAAGEPWPQVLAAMPATFPSPKIFTPEIALPWTRAMQRAGQALATTRAGRVAIAVERYRRQQGMLPASLADLPGPLPADPFTGHDFLYRRAEDAFVVSSAGPAQAGDGDAVDEGVRAQDISVCLKRSGRGS